MIDSFLTKIFGSKSAKDIKRLTPIVEEINEIFDGLNTLTDEELQAKTVEFRDKIHERTVELENLKQELIEKLRNEVLEAEEINDTNAQIKTIDSNIYAETETVLNEILPEAFAVVKRNLPPAEG